MDIELNILSMNILVTYAVAGKYLHRSKVVLWKSEKNQLTGSRAKNVDNPRRIYRRGVCRPEFAHNYFTE